MDYEFVTDADRLGHIAEEIRCAEVVGIDLETTSLDPYLGKIRIFSVDTGKGIYVVDLFETGTLGPIRDALDNPECESGKERPVVVAQNAKFEQKWVRHHEGMTLWPLFDPYRASNILYNGRYHEHNLLAIYSRELEFESGVRQMGKERWDGALTQVHKDYAAEDVAHLLRLREIMRAKVINAALGRIALIEFQAVLPEAAIELSGFYLDSNEWEYLYEQNAEKAIDLRERLLDELPHPLGQRGLFGAAPWNVDSPHQVLASLQRMGIPIEDTRKESMAMVAGMSPVVRQLMEYRKVSKRVTSFGVDYLNHIHPVTGRIHCSYYPFTGAGRYACVIGDTLVRTSRGLRRVEEIRPGDIVWTHRGRWRCVTAFLYQGVRPTYSVHLDNGHVLTCTADHRLLLSDGSWVTVEEIARECIEDLGCGWDDGRGEKGTCRPSLLGNQEGFQESYVGEKGGEAPQMEGVVRGWEGILDLSASREETIYPPNRYGRSSEFAGATIEHGRASYRRKSQKQRSEQSGASDQIGAQLSTLYAGEGQSFVTVEKIYASGSVAVYDLTVEEDESYETCGIFSHNCSKPNLQQIPRDKQYRNCFRAPDGWVLVVADYSAIELRLAAEISQDPLLLAIFSRGEDPHIKTASLISGTPYDEITSDQRQKAKPFNFGLAFGLMPRMLVIYAQANYGVSMTLAEAKDLWRKFFDAYQGLRAWQNSQTR